MISKFLEHLVYLNFYNSQSKIESCKPTRKNKTVKTAFQKSTRKPTESYAFTRIINQQLDIKLGPFTQEELDLVLIKIKNRKAARLDEIPREVWKTITKTIQVRRTRHAGHCWRSRDELISDVLLWTPTYGRAKAGRPARTYIQQLCEDTGCSPEDLPEAMNDTEKWRERGQGYPC